MGMGKILLLLSFLGLAILTLGTLIAPDTPTFWLAASSANFERMRTILMVVLFAQLATRPPRHLAFRVVAGAIAGVTAMWVIIESQLYHMMFLDSTAFMAACIAIAVTALERKAAPAAKTYRRPASQH